MSRRLFESDWGMEEDIPIITFARLAWLAGLYFARLNTRICFKNCLRVAYAHVLLRPTPLSLAFDTPITHILSAKAVTRVCMVSHLTSLCPAQLTDHRQNHMHLLACRMSIQA